VTLVPLAIRARIRPSWRTQVNARLAHLEARDQAADRVIAAISQPEPQRPQLTLIRGGR
jgi:hypothetical protein